MMKTIKPATTTKPKILATTSANLTSSVRLNQTSNGALLLSTTPTSTAISGIANHRFGSAANTKSLVLGTINFTATSNDKSKNTIPIEQKPKRKRQRLDHLTQEEKIMRR